MAKAASFLCLCLIISAVTCKPANNEQLDKSLQWTLDEIERLRNVHLGKSWRDTVGYYESDATVNDVSINTVSEDKRADQPIGLTQTQKETVSSPPSTIHISGISTGVDTPAVAADPAENPPFKPQRTGSMFARFIDDIFQIPITVLQNVAKLITNPFTQAKKDAAITATVS